MSFKFFICLFLASFLSENALALSGDQRPDYQKEYDAYLHDLQFIEKKGYAPKNSILEDDLAKMSSEDRIRLTSPFKKKTQSESAVLSDEEGQLKIADNEHDKDIAPKKKAEIVKRVEIIRVPEEFREQYADIYAEETKHISSQSLVEEQEANRKKVLEDRNAAKVAEHDNPFRLLKEKELETKPFSVKNNSEAAADSMTRAYFQQQKRAFVSGDPIIIKKKEVKKETSTEDEKDTFSDDDSALSTKNVSNSVEKNKYRSNGKYRNLTGGFARGPRGSKMFLE